MDLHRTWDATDRGPGKGARSGSGTVTAGHFGTKVPSPGIGGEFETLTSSFNDMAAQLQALEGTRRRLLGDIGHELRTPVATVDGYLEEMQDGVIQPDGETISMLRIQMSRLARLADDIGAVSRAEEARIHLQPLASDDLVRTAVAVEPINSSPPG